MQKRIFNSKILNNNIFEMHSCIKLYKKATIYGDFTTADKKINKSIQLMIKFYGLTLTRKIINEEIKSEELNFNIIAGTFTGALLSTFLGIAIPSLLGLCSTFFTSIDSSNLILSVSTSILAFIFLVIAAFPVLIAICIIWVTLKSKNTTNFLKYYQSVLDNYKIRAYKRPDNTTAYKIVIKHQ